MTWTNGCANFPCKKDFEGLPESWYRVWLVGGPLDVHQAALAWTRLDLHTTRLVDVYLISWVDHSIQKESNY